MWANIIQWLPRIKKIFTAAVGLGVIVATNNETVQNEVVSLIFNGMDAFTDIIINPAILFFDQIYSVIYDYTKENYF